MSPAPTPPAAVSLTVDYAAWVRFPASHEWVRVHARGSQHEAGLVLCYVAVVSRSGIALAVIGTLVAGFGLFLLAGVIAIATQGKPLDVMTSVVAVGLMVLGLLALRSSWRSRQVSSKPL